MEVDDFEEKYAKDTEEIDEIFKDLKRSEREGAQNILKYFDRIHDKLFTFNNILIAGYFALSQFFESFSVYGIIIPLINLALLIIIEYRMMEKSRFDAQVTKKPKDEIDQNGSKISRTTRYSLYSIISTSIVVGVFIFNLFNLDSKAVQVVNNNTTIQHSEYGYAQNGKDNLKVSLLISSFNKYGEIVDRIRQITCNDSIPKIVIKNRTIVRNIFPAENCEPIKFDPRGKHYVTFVEGKAYHNNGSKELSVDSLERMLLNDFSYYSTPNLTNEPNSYLVIIESKRNEKIIGIEKFISELTREFDNLKTNLNLNIAFWEVVPHIPPPPEKPIELEKDE